MTCGRQGSANRRSRKGGAARLAALQEPQVSLRSRIIDALRRAIETGVLAPGARLIERELCEQLKVSRTSLREALGELQAEGILSYSPTRRLSVSVISRADAENAYRIRGTLEALIVEQFIEQANEGDVVALIAEGENLKAAYRSGDVDRMLVAKRAFYDRICSGAQNTIAFDIINRLVLTDFSVAPPLAAAARAAGGEHHGDRYSSCRDRTARCKGRAPGGADERRQFGQISAARPIDLVR